MKKLKRLGKNFRTQKYKIMFGVHLRYALIQCLFVLVLYLATERDIEFRHFITYTLLVGGFWVFPIMVIKRINRFVRPVEGRAGFGSYILQAGITAVLLYFFAPLSRHWLFMSLVCIVGSIVLLLFSVKRVSKKRALPIATTIAE